MDSKAKIFKALNEADGILSGETICAELGISRVSVWKHIQAMVASGISIASSPKGYELAADPDSLVPWYFGERQERIHYFQGDPLHNGRGHRPGAAGLPRLHTVVVAQRQTRGRGRMKRTWVSADGGLYFTIVVRPTLAVMSASLVNLAAAIDMADLLRSAYSVDAVLKWPNDILAGQRKLCGILSQMEIEGGQVAYISIGIGLNVNNAPEKKEPAATSLRALLKRPLPRREILVEFLNRFEKRMTHFDADAVVAQWKANNATIGRPVRIETVDNTHTGTAVDIDPYGGLILRRADGTLQTITHGDCFYQ
jgi:BirA family biotin operon repressor/biotin-[acetyl-CoA-carboxylase] ligase